MKDHAPRPRDKQLGSQPPGRSAAIADNHADSAESVERTSVGRAGLLLVLCADFQWTWSEAERHSCQLVLLLAAERMQEPKP